VTARDVQPADFAAIRRLLIAAFGGEVEARLVEQLRADGDSEIELVAEELGRIVGHILFSLVAAPFRALALAPVAVLPDRQRGGIGSALIEAGHERAADKGWRGIFVLGEPDYYRRFGYSRALASGFSSPYAGEYFMALALGGPLPATGGEVRHARAFAAVEE
jgi:putative acetyltransferase